MNVMRSRYSVVMSGRTLAPNRMPTMDHIPLDCILPESISLKAIPLDPIPLESIYRKVRS